MMPDPDRMAALAGPLITVAAKIRALDAAGYAKADIARFLGKRYQHVRNVLQDVAAKVETPGYVVGRADLSGVNESPTSFEQDRERSLVEARPGGNFRLVVRDDGSVLVPDEVIAALALQPGAVLMARLQGEDFTLTTSATAVRRIQSFVRELVPAGVSLADDLIADRRRDAQAEAGERG